MDQIYQASIWKRLLADLIDFLMFALVLLAFDLPQYLGAWDVFGVSEMNREEIEDRRKTGLFEISEDGEDFYYISFDMSSSDRQEQFNRILDAIAIYYLEYKPFLDDTEVSKEEKAKLTNSFVNIEILKIDPYNLASDILSISDIDCDPREAKLLPILGSGDNQYTSEDDEYWEIAVSSMNNEDSQGSYDLAVTDYADLPHLKANRDRRRQIHSYQILWSAAIPCFLFYLLIPCLLPHCQSLGKKFEHIGAVSKDGYNATPLQRVSRAVVQALFIYVSCCFLIFIPLVVDLIIELATKQHRSLTDFVAGTTVIDLNTSTLIDPKDAPSEDSDRYEKFD